MSLAANFDAIFSTNQSGLVSGSLMLASSVSIKSFMVAHPDRGLNRQTSITENEDASSFCDLLFTADGSDIIMQVSHKDGRSAKFTIDSKNTDELIIFWNGTVTIQLEELTKAATVKQGPFFHIVTLN